MSLAVSKGHENVNLESAALAKKLSCLSWSATVGAGLLRIASGNGRLAKLTVLQLFVLHGLQHLVLSAAQLSL